MDGIAIYSPVEQIFDPLFAEKKVKVFVKRDDMIHPIISGNKWRKLKYILAEAQNLNKNHLVTFGGAFSSHLLATACAAARLGLRSTGIVRGDEVKNDVLMLCRLFGMELIFVDRTSYKDKKALFNTHFNEDSQAIFIDEGGAGELGVKGCSELVDELHENYDHIICAAGTGTTAAGILRGLEKQSFNPRMHIIPVLKGADFLTTEIESFTQYPFEMHLEYHTGGYAKTSAELLEFIRYFCRSTGILIEPVYTGKMFYALYDLIRKDSFSEGSNILAIHTGGLMGILGMSAKFG